MSTHNIGFYDEDLTKIIFKLSSNMHLISSSDFMKYSTRTGIMCIAHVLRKNNIP